MTKKSTSFFSLIISLFIFLNTNCSSIPQPQYVQEKLDYTQEDVIQNEISNIKKLQESKSVYALWRATFINNQEILDLCISTVEEQLKQAIENKDYYEGMRLLLSLKNSGNKYNLEYEQLLHKIIVENIPGLNSNNKYSPKSIKDCVNGTVTIWVDKGLKIENGNVLPDVTIGSGFFIDERGYLITNYHVIEDYIDTKYKGIKNLYVILPANTEEKIPAKVIGYDSLVDLALIKVDINPEIVFSLGSSEDLEIGDKISVIGTPIGLEGTITSGIISSVNRKLTVIGSVFQIDAAVNSGNSGGPMIDQNFTVQAVVFAGMLQFQGLNFAIPVEYLKQELSLLYNGGKINHSWIGAFGHDYKVHGKSSGLEIQYVVPGCSAQFANLQPGDIILEIDNHKINSLDDFQLSILQYTPDTIVKCKYMTKDGEEKQTLLYLENRPEYPAKLVFESDLISNSFLPLYGMKMDPTDTRRHQSFVLLQVLKNSMAEELGFSVLDPVTLMEVKCDDENEAIFSKIYIRRKKQGFLDISIMLGASYDSPYYF